MKQQLSSSVKRIFKDRYLTTLLCLYVLLNVAVIVYLCLSIHPSELQVVVHYTTFGLTNFYRDKWYYLLTFVAFIIVSTLVHIVLAYKLLDRKDRQFAIGFLWLGCIVTAIAVILFYQIMKVASLS